MHCVVVSVYKKRVWVKKIGIQILITMILQSSFFWCSQKNKNNSIARVFTVVLPIEKGSDWCEYISFGRVKSAHMPKRKKCSWNVKFCVFVQRVVPDHR